jgi:beta-galactosidase
VDLDFPEIIPQPGVEYFLNLSYFSNLQNNMIPLGHEIAQEQFLIPLYVSKQITDESRSAMILREVQDNVLTLRGTEADFTYSFDLSQGEWSSLRYADTELLKLHPSQKKKREPSPGLSPFFWRAPTDNDFGNDMPVRQAVWKHASYTRTVEKVEYRQNSNRDVLIEVTWFIPAVNSRFQTIYHVFGDGDIVVNNRFLPGSDMLPDLPRMGMQMILGTEFENMRWYGRGPQETYWDRKSGARIGEYSGKVWEQYHAYVRPQENGNKTDVRWASFTNDQGIGLLVLGDPTLNFSAHHFLSQDLDPGPRKQQRHTTDIKRRDLILLHLDYQQMGVGGDTSWGARPHPQYSLKAKEYSFRFCLRPFSQKKINPMDLSKFKF